MRRGAKSLLPKQIGLMFAMMLVATFIDWIVHSSNPAWYVEPGYYRNKIIFGAFWGLVAYFAFRKKMKNRTWLAVAVSAVIALVLQMKYFLQQRDPQFVFLFAIFHFLMFLPPAWFIFKKFPYIFVKGEQ